MAIFSVSDVRVAGISAAVPKNTVHNSDYNWISREDREKLIETVGISERRIAPKGMTSGDICQTAAEELLDRMGWERSSVDLLVFVSQFRDYIIPCTAPILQDRLNLSRSCLAFDIPLGCSGYLYGMSVVASMLSQPGLNRALLLVGDVSSQNISYHDRRSYPLFGDAGTATALEQCETDEPMNFHLQTDGSGYDMIIIPDGGTRSPVTRGSFANQRISEGVIRSRTDVALNGKELFEFALTEVKPNIGTLLTECGIDQRSIDRFVFHQANRLMVEVIRKMMKIPEEKVPYSLKLYGNTITATIPLTIVSELRKEAEARSLRVLLSGFGIGLSWGSAVLRLENAVIPPLIEI